MIVYKYEILPGYTEILLPKSAQLLSVQMQEDTPRLWVLLDPHIPIEEWTTRTFVATPTGKQFVEKIEQYIGTFQIDELLVFHLFEITL